MSCSKLLGGVSVPRSVVVVVCAHVLRVGELSHVPVAPEDDPADAGRNVPSSRALPKFLFVQSRNFGKKSVSASRIRF